MVDLVTASTRQLLISVHDVTSGNASKLHRIHRMLQTSGVACRYCMLVVPDFWNENPLSDAPEFTDWLQELSSEGVEIALHGYSHLDSSEHGSLPSRLRAALSTRGEGEFNTLTRPQALRRLEKGRDELCSLIGLRARGFVAPAWLYSRESRQALGELGFDWAEDRLKVWSPSSGETLVRSPVICFSCRSRFRVLKSLVWCSIAPAVLQPWKTVRLAIHPSDTDSYALFRAVPALIERLGRTRRFAGYRDLLARGTDALSGTIH
jgi:hypothetical protein